jgi:peptidoglycan/xylan/chitin deacetylase (PgdA/CDA1 family)
MIRDAGHEIGLHGYSHENPVEMTLEQQTAVLDKSYKLITDFCGKPPRGMVAPWWESSKEGAELTLKYGIEYEHNFSHHDCQGWDSALNLLGSSTNISKAYFLRIADEWTPIDYKKDAETWMKPLVMGKPTGLVEIPSSWYLGGLSHPLCWRLR